MHGRGRIVILISLAMAGAMATGCQMPLSARAQQQLASGQESYQRKDYSGTVAKMDEFLRENERSSAADEGYFLRGLAEYDLKNYDAAKSDLEQVVTRTKNPDVRARASLALANLSYDTGDMVLAENMYRHALASLPAKHEKAAEAHYRLGSVLQRQGRWREADAEFYKVTYYFPNTEPARRAGRAINSTAWTVQTGSFANMRAAETAAKKLRGQNLPAQAASAMSDSGVRYVVQVGRFDRFEEAATTVAQARKIQSDAFITSTR